MGRGQLWDQDEVLASAMRLFRERGYTGASVRDIEEATGVHPGSLYRTFRSKDGLFHAAFDAYNEQLVRGRARIHLTEPADPLPGIRSFFTSAIETGTGPDRAACSPTRPSSPSPSPRPPPACTTAWP
ncbi:TetR/AcrR family transcriptional regulator [Streptomyces sp. NPDC002287]